MKKYTVLKHFVVEDYLLINGDIVYAEARKLNSGKHYVLFFDEKTRRKIGSCMFEEGELRHYLNEE